MEITVSHHKIEETNFSKQEIKRARKALKKNNIPKHLWFIEILNKETGELNQYYL